MALILYVDTSSQFTHLLLCENLLIIREKVSDMPNTHAQTLNVQIEQILAESNKSWRDLEGIMVMNGPGSYTGLRISLASAKGYCFGLDIPLFLTNRFEIMKEKTLNQFQCAIYILEARKNEYYTCYYQNELPNYCVLSEIEINEIAVKLNKLIFSTEKKIENEFENLNLLKIENKIIANIAHNKFNNKEVESVLNSEPFYVKEVYINK